MKKSQLAIRILMIVFILLLTTNIYQTRKNFKTLNRNYNGFMAARADVEKFERASNYLTSQARLYVANGKQTFLENYLRELRIEKNREAAIEKFEKNAGSDNEVLLKLKACLKESEELAQIERKAMMLVAYANDADKELIDQLGEVELTDIERAIGAEGAEILAINMLFSEEYDNEKSKLDNELDECAQMVTEESEKDGNKRLKIVDALLKLMFGFVIVVAVVEAVLFIPSVSGGSFFGSFEDEDNKKSLEAIEQIKKETEEINKMLK